MIKHTLVLSAILFSGLMLIYSIPSNSIVFESPTAEAAPPLDEMIEKVKAIETEIKTVKLAVANLDEVEKSDLNRIEPMEKSEEVREVPFYSQFDDISRTEWKKIGCGVASLAMLVDYYKPAVSVDTLLEEGIAAKAYLSNAGWIHAGLIGLSEKYGLTGSSNSLSHLSADAAFAELQTVLKEGPVMASVYYTFTPGHPIPHLVVINDVVDDVVYYNDPAEPDGGGTISVSDFKPAWKQRYIEIRPI